MWKGVIGRSQNKCVRPRFSAEISIKKQQQPKQKNNKLFETVLFKIVRKSKNLQKVIDFIGFPGIDGIRSMCHFCSKLPEIARISNNWSILWDFLVWMEFDRCASSARNCQKSPEILRISKKWSILWDFLVMMKFDRCATKRAWLAPQNNRLHQDSHHFGSQCEAPSSFLEN